MAYTIGTHSGNFQCDDALGIWMLRQLPKFKQANLIRSRDQDVLETQCDIVVDVGGLYDGEFWFDHHQKGFFETMEGFGTKLSAAGLVYKHFGRDVLQVLRPELNGDALEKVYNKLYKVFLEPLDNIDNGVEAGENLLYRDMTDLSSRILRMNQRWNEPKLTQDEEDARFEKASAYAGNEFCEQLNELIDNWLPSRVIVMDAVKNRMEYDSSGKIIYLEHGGTPWKQHIYTIERELKLDENILYVLYQSEPDNFRVHTVSVEGTAYTNRKSLPAQWCGLQGDELSAIALIDGCIFAHDNGFVAANKTKEGAIEMAKAAVHLTV